MVKKFGLWIIQKKRWLIDHHNGRIPKFCSVTAAMDYIETFKGRGIKGVNFKELEIKEF